MALNKNTKMFVIYVGILLMTLTMHIYFFCQAQIRLLLANKALIKVLPKYLDYIDIFLFDLIIELFENTSIN